MKLEDVIDIKKVTAGVDVKSVYTFTEKGGMVGDPKTNESSGSDNIALLATTGSRISSSQNSIIIAGFDQVIENSNVSSIVGGYNNKIQNFKRPAGEGDNIGNSIFGSFTSIISGSTTVVDKGPKACLIIGGARNEINSDDSALFNIIVGGYQNKILADSNYSSIIGGWVNRIDSSAQRAAVIAGQGNTVDHDGSVILGSLNRDSDNIFTTYVTNLKAFGDITASGIISAAALNVTHFTSSYVTASTIQTEGDTIFGDTLADTHLFNGHITASGDISASGDIRGDTAYFANSAGVYADKIRRYSDSGTTTKIVLNDEVIKIHAGNSSNEVFNIQQNRVDINAPITASENISSSGKGIFDTIDVKSSITGSYPNLTDSEGNTIYKISGLVSSATEKVQMGDVNNENTGERLVLDANNEEPIFYSDPGAEVKWGVNIIPSSNDKIGITVLGNISASKDVYGKSAYFTDNITGSKTSKFGSHPSHTHQFTGNITASANISSSLTSTGSFGRLEVTSISASSGEFDTGTVYIGGEAINQTLVKNLKRGNSSTKLSPVGETRLEGKITASGDLIISGNITPSHTATKTTGFYLGAADKRFKGVYLASTIDVSGSQLIIQAPSASAAGDDFNVIISGSVLPVDTGSHSLGSLSKPFKDLYVTTGSINFVKEGVKQETLSSFDVGRLREGKPLRGTAVKGDTNKIKAKLTGGTEVSGSTVHKLETFTNRDATPSVSGGTIFLTGNTRATTITAFDNPEEGQHITIIIKDANTDFTNGGISGKTTGRLLLQGNTNWTAATTGDTIAFVYNGGMWIETNRSDNT